jgi:hypothetical protein
MARGGQRVHVGGVQIIQGFGNLLVKIIVVDVVAVGICRRGEAIGNLNVFSGKFPIHFSQRRILTTYLGYIMNAEFNKTFNMLVLLHVVLSLIKWGAYYVDTRGHSRTRENYPDRVLKNA